MSAEDAPPDDPALITRDLLFELLAELDAALEGEEPVSLLVVGGAAVMVIVEERTTYDVDVARPELQDPIMRAAAVIGDRRGLRSDWLNDAFLKAFPERAAATASRETTAVYAGDNLRVLMPPAHELIRLKLAAGREQDIKDLAELMAREATNWTIEEWISHLEATFGEQLDAAELGRLMRAYFEARRRTLEREQWPPPERRLGR